MSSVPPAALPPSEPPAPHVPSAPTPEPAREPQSAAASTSAQASAFAQAQQEPLSPPRRGLSPWIALAAVAVLGLPIVGGTGAAMYFLGESAASASAPGAPEAESPWDFLPPSGTVTGADGTEKPEAGTEEQPAAVGDVLTWPTPEGGTVRVVVSGIDEDADALVADADPENPPADHGTHYTQIALEVSVEGEGVVDPFEDIWVTAETDGESTSDADVRAIPADSVREIGGLGDGESGSGTVLLMVPDEAEGGVQYSIAPLGADPLFIAGE